MTDTFDLDQRISEEDDDNNPDFIPVPPVLDPATGQVITTSEGYNEAVNRTLAEITDKWGDQLPPELPPELAERARRIGRRVTESAAEGIPEDPIVDMSWHYTYRDGKPVVEVIVSGLTDYLPYSGDNVPGDTDRKSFARKMIARRSLGHSEPE
jgi:hypothetical protein